MNVSIKRILDRIENSALTPGRWIIFFLAITYTRNILEGALERSRVIGAEGGALQSFQSVFLLYALEWAALFCVVIIILHYASSRPILSLLKITLAFFPIILIVPFVDFIAYFPRGAKVEYVFTLRGYMDALVFFFVPWKEAGAPAGVRIEVFISCVLAFLYVLARTEKPVKAALATALIYFFAVSSMCFPVFILLPALAFVPDFDAFIQAFFAGSADFSMTAKLGIMIFPLLTFSAALALRLYSADGFRKALRLFLLPKTLLFSALAASGFIYTADYSSPFFPALIFAFILLGALIAVIADISPWNSGKTFNPAPFAAASFFTAILSLLLSFYVFMTVLLAVLLSLAFPEKKRAITLNLSHRIVYYITALIVHISGIVFTNGPYLSSIAWEKPSYTALILAVTAIAVFVCPKNKAAMTAASFTGFVLYAAAPAIFASPVLAAVSLVCGAAFAAAVLTCREENKKQAILYSTVSIFSVFFALINRA